MMTTRSPSVMASTWSWVTNTEVVGISRMQALDLDAHLRAQLGVEVGQRLVEQEHLRVAHDAAAERDALLLAAGQLLRLALQAARAGPSMPAARSIAALISASGIFLLRRPKARLS